MYKLVNTFGCKKQAFKKSFDSLENKQPKNFDNQELKKNQTNVHVNHSVDHITQVTYEYKKGYQGRTDGENCNSKQEHLKLTLLRLVFGEFGNFNFIAPL